MPTLEPEQIPDFSPPGWREFLRKVNTLPRDALEFCLPFEKQDLALATVCFQDTKDVLVGAHFAFIEFHRQRGGVQKAEDDQYLKIFMERYYLDDLLIRLYPAGEHLAGAIFYMLELGEADLEPYRGGRVSRQSVIGKFLLDRKPDHPVTLSVKKLAESEAWSKAMAYRGEWVHGQPPIVEGTGMMFKRRSGWKKEDGEDRVYLLGYGDAPQYTTDDILGFAGPALALFLEVAIECMDFYLRLLSNYGIKADPAKGTIEFILF